MKFASLRILLVCTLGLGLFGSTLQAQAGDADRSKADAGKTVTVTGCLQKGDEPDEYSITDTAGKTYGLRSTTVKLAGHVNHKVTVTGTTANEESEKQEHEKGSKAEKADLNVSNLKMVSTSCQ